MARNEYDETKALFESMRGRQEKIVTINESGETGNGTGGGGSIPYTMQDSLMSSITQTAKMQFGANFSGLKSPMLYYPEDGDVTLSGTIPGMGTDVKFQYRYKDSSGNGCFVWGNCLVLSDETLNTLKKVLGVYKNWRQSLSSAEDIKPMSYKDKGK